MQRTYIIFLSIFTIFIGFNLYMYFQPSDEPKESFLLSAGIGFIGVLLVFLLNMIANLRNKNKA